ncbi:MAG TPA: beta-galactosidase domain 4-containing protein [Puia sp.]|nr:beta-galactosidase domain 4-containing protein [Puia sp.]
MLRQDKSDLRIRETRLHAKVDPADGYKKGTLDITLLLTSRPSAGTKAAVDIRSSRSEKGKVPATPIRKVFPITDTSLSVTLPVPAVRLWSAETPTQYEVRVRLTDSSGHVLDSTSEQVCFRDITLRNGRYYVNGRSIWIKGMHLQRFDTSEIRLIKQYNITAVQETDADKEKWHALCDRYGLYIVGTSGQIRNFAPCGPMPDNSLGGLRDYWDTIRRYPDRYPGSFVYDMFSAGDRPVPAALEVKKVYQPVLTTLATGSKGIPGIAVQVFNDYAFQDLSHLSMEWQVLTNGVAGQHGKANMPVIGPQRTGRIQIPVRMPATGEVLLNITYRQKRPGSMLPAGHIVASEQLMLREALAGDVSVHPAGELTFKDEGGTFGISSPATGLDLQFNKQTGWLQHYVVEGRSLLEDTLGLTADFWRSPTDCDYADKLPMDLSVWKHATRESRLQLFSTSTSTDFVIVRADYLLPEAACLLHVHYTINAKGEMQVEEILETDTTQTGNTDTSTVVKKTMLPRLGMKWVLPAGYDSVVYYGRGPQENYADRNYAADLGIHRQTVDEQFYPYRRPQECGTRTDVRWWKVTDHQGHGLQITADSALLSISALHYFDNDLDEGKTIPRPQTQLDIDLRQMGLDGKRLPYGNYHYIYKVTPF